ncbi:MAG: 16S rRNA (guanine(966)-N(2))-methyltransferase RsmD [Candidatus Bipolaricaulota bacterium]|nr:16S rRNA (guanine(966)-N(2))-methyltransferase RsmD [Candidatus Bipolaricaulota bacterium]
MRIGGGAYRGQRLQGPRGAGIRPLRDRVRLALFDLLRDLVPGARFLDLYAGTGAVGLEALSRGASHAVFVDASPGAARVIRENVRRLGCADRAEVLERDAFSALRAFAREGRQFDLAFVGAPYGTGLAAQTAELLGELHPLVPGAVVVVESFHKEPIADRYGPLMLELRRRYGETVLSLYRFVPPGGGG